MADKHHSGRFVKDKQREIYQQQRKSLGMDLERESSDFDKSVITFDDAEQILQESIIQNGRIEAQCSALDKNSKVKKEYDAFRLNNEKYINNVKNKGNDM